MVERAGAMDDFLTLQRHRGSAPLDLVRVLASAELD